MQLPTFEQACRASKNGKAAITACIKGRVFRYRAGKSRSRGWMDFDLYSGNHDIKQSVQDNWRERYAQYCRQHAFTPTCYYTFTRLVFRCQVRLEDAEGWFNAIYSSMSNVRNLERVRFIDLIPPKTSYTIPVNLLKTVEKHADGDLVTVDPDKFESFIRDLTIDYKILHLLKPRDVEKVVAAIFASSGFFDRVILTPRSADLGRDVILEKAEWGSDRLVIEVKAYRRRKVPSEKVDALLGVLTGETPRSMACLAATSTFAPKLTDRPHVAKALRRNLQLIDFVDLVEACIQSCYTRNPDFLDHLNALKAGALGCYTGSE